MLGWIFDVILATIASIFDRRFTWSEWYSDRRARRQTKKDLKEEMKRRK